MISGYGTGESKLRADQLKLSKINLFTREIYYKLNGKDVTAVKCYFEIRVINKGWGVCHGDLGFLGLLATIGELECS